MEMHFRLWLLVLLAEMCPRQLPDDGFDLGAARAGILPAQMAVTKVSLAVDHNFLVSKGHFTGWVVSSQI